MSLLAVVITMMQPVVKVAKPKHLGSKLLFAVASQVRQYSSLLTLIIKILP
jgi:hypothetical protein